MAALEVAKNNLVTFIKLKSFCLFYPPSSLKFQIFCLDGQNVLLNHLNLRKTDRENHYKLTFN